MLAVNSDQNDSFEVIMNRYQVRKINEMETQISVPRKTLNHFKSQVKMFPLMSTC